MITQVTHNVVNVVHGPISGTCLEHRELMKTSEKQVWQNSFAHELGRLSQGCKPNDVAGTNTLHFIPWIKLPSNKKPAHARMCCTYPPQKIETYRTRMIAGGDKTPYSRDTVTPSAGVTTTKIHINITISTPGQDAVE